MRRRLGFLAPGSGLRLLAAAAASLLIASRAAAFDVRALLPVIVAPPGATVDVAIELDRGLDGLGVQSIQYRMPIDPTYITSALPLGDGLVWSWGTPFVNVTPTSVSVVATGMDPIVSTTTRLHTLRLTISPGAPLDTDMALTLSIFTLNEGNPSAAPRLGLLKIRSQPVGIAEPQGSTLALDPPTPDPVLSTAHIAFSLPQDLGEAPVRLAIHALDGRRVRLLANGVSGPGPHAVRWDGRDDRGRRLPAGLYFCALECGGRRLVRRLALLQ